MSSNFGLTLVLVHSCARAALDVACFLVVADVERALDDEADYLRREAAGEFRCEGRSEGVEVVALVGRAGRRTWAGRSWTSLGDVRWGCSQPGSQIVSDMKKPWP